MNCFIVRHPETGQIEQVTAPNGEPSSLYDQIRAVLPENYQPDTYVQAALDQQLIADDSKPEIAAAIWSKIYTPPFKAWFGDWTNPDFAAPELIDKNGEPLVGVLPDGGFTSSTNKTYYTLTEAPDDLVYDLGPRPVNVLPAAIVPEEPLVKRQFTQWQQALKADDPLLMYRAIEQSNGTLKVEKVLRKSAALTRMHPRIKLQDITERMGALFPQLHSRIITETELAEFDFGALSPELNTVKSFIQNGIVYLVEGRVTAEAAIEEWLHPFVAALGSVNPSLFQQLLQEALNRYPSILQQVQSTYTASKGFTDEDRNQEVVTKILSDGLSRRITEKPSDRDYSLAGLVRRFFVFLHDTLQQLTGIKKLYVGEIPTDITIDELLTLLDEGAQIELGTLNTRTFFNLTTAKLEVYNRILVEANDVQRGLVEALAQNNGIFIEDRHEYIHADSGEAFTSVTKRIKGQIDEMDPYAINRSFGKEFDFIMNAIALNKPLNEIKAQLRLLKPDVIDDFYEYFSIFLAGIKSTGAIVVPQLILADEVSMVAGTLDLLIIDPDGNMDIVDLKVSKSTVLGKSYNKPWLIDKTPSVFFGKLLSTRQQHGIQQHAYKKLIELTGVPVRSVRTLHFRVNIIGDLVTGFDPESYIDHTTTNYTAELNAVIPTPLPAAPAYRTLHQAQAMPENAPVVERIQDVVTAFQQKVHARKAYFENINESTTGKTSASSAYLADLGELINSIDEEKAKGSPAGAFYTIIKFINQDLKHKTEQVTGAKVSKEKLIDFLLETEKDIKEYIELLSVPKLQLDNPTLKNLASEALNFADGLQTVIDLEVKSFVKTFVRSNSSRNFTEEQLEELLRQSKDISQADYLLGDLATSSDTLLATLDKVYKSKLQGIYDFTDEMAREFSRLGNRLAELGGGKPSYEFMIQRDKRDKPTGYYVRKIGRQYWDLKKELKNKIQTENGESIQYKYIKNIDTAAPEDLQFNLDLMVNKTAYRIFMQAEQLDESEKLVDGGYHRYKADFKAIRDQYEYLHIEKKDDKVLYHEWRKHSHVPESAYKRYLATYYTDEVVYLSPVKDPVGHGRYEYQGRVAERSARFVKNEFSEPREYASNGESILDPRYEKLMNPTTELERAEKEFYEAWIKYYEVQLRKLPAYVRRLMSGRLPLIRDRFSTTIKSKAPSIVKGILKGMRNLNPFDLKIYSHNVLTNENGEIENQVPVYYVGDFQQEKAIEKLETKIRELGDKLRTKAITYAEYKAQLARLRKALSTEKGKITQDEMLLDMTAIMIEFAKMAENYLVMSAFESTVEAVERVATNRKYVREGAVETDVSRTTHPPAKFTGHSSLVVQRLEKWKEMVFYRTTNPYQSTFGQIARKIMQYMSIKNVALNPFGQINNYLIGKINNAIENAAGVYWDRTALMRATKLYNTDYLRGLLVRRSTKLIGKGDYYEIDQPYSKYEALASLFRMMRKLQSGDTLQGLEDRVLDAAYVMQESAEYNLQTKTGMAILMTRTLENSITKEKVSVYDAFEFDQQKRELKLLKGFDLPAELRHSITNYIYEVNKQIHGNYADPDRMVIQQHILGEMAAQYHKHIFPGYKTRYKKGYVDENLGEIEGRYETVWNFMRYAWDLKNLSDSWDMLSLRQRANLYKASADLAFMMLSVAFFHLFMAIGAGIDDDDEQTKRFVHWMTSQSDRLYDEISMGILIVGTQQQYQLLKSPLAILGFAKDGMEVAAEALKMPLPPYDDLYFKSGVNKGELRLKKELMDVIPLLNLVNRWDSYETVKQFYIR